jgi:hypothetical protein
MKKKNPPNAERMSPATSYTLPPHYIQAIRNAANLASLREGRQVSASEILRRLIERHFGEGLVAG